MPQLIECQPEARDKFRGDSMEKCLPFGLLAVGKLGERMENGLLEWIPGLVGKDNFSSTWQRGIKSTKMID